MGLLLPEDDFLPGVGLPLTVCSSPFLYCAIEVTECDRGITGDGAEFGTLSSSVSNRGSVAHFLIGETPSSGTKTSEVRDERLPLGELPYPLDRDI